MADLDAVLSIARDLTASLASSDRYRRLLDAVRSVIPCEAATLLRLEGATLVPLAAHGLVPEILGRRFPRTDHPRLDLICRSEAPVRFPPDSSLPDPFDGLLLGDPSARHPIHACLGCPLRVEGRLVGALTADARDGRAFDHLDDRLVSFLAALAGAAMRTSELIDRLERAARHQGEVARDLLRDFWQRQGGELLGTSPAIERLRTEIGIVAKSSLPVLITGETGVGKELVARAIHAQSDRKDAPLLYVNCAALPESVAESELFGHVRGAFTGAVADRPGKLEVADGGTLLLDEIGELPSSIQPKLLRALQHGEVQRVGADRALLVDVRILAATNRDLVQEVEAGRFRADLFHRLNVYPIHVPPLRERRGDIPILAGYHGDEMRRRLGTEPIRLAPDAREALLSHSWPGNVRELENVIARAALRAAAAVPRGQPIILAARDLGPEFSSPPGAGAQAPLPAGAAGSGAPDHGPLRDSPDAGPAASILAHILSASRGYRSAVDAFERALIEETVRRHEGNWAAAARALGLHRSNLHRLAKRLGLL
jgi:anaerobic nitric oxide reductase transcription regulator